MPDTPGSSTAPSADLPPGLEAVHRLLPDIFAEARDRGRFMPPQPRSIADMTREPATEFRAEASDG